MNDEIEEYNPAKPIIDIGMGIASFNTDLYLFDDNDQVYENVSQCALPVTMQQSLTDYSRTEQDLIHQAAVNSMQPVFRAIGAKLTLWNVKFDEYNSYEYEKHIGHRAYN